MSILDLFPNSGEFLLTWLVTSTTKNASLARMLSPRCRWMTRVSSPPAYKAPNRPRAPEANSHALPRVPGSRAGERSAIDEELEISPCFLGL